MRHLPLLSCSLLAVVHAQGPLQGTFTAYGQGCPAPVGSVDPEFRELFGGGGFDLANTAVEMIPLGPQGYLIHQSPTVPFFAGFTNGTNLNDDQTLPVALPFAFPTPLGPTNTVGLCSNGFVHLSSSLSSSFSPNVAQYLSGEPRIFGCWADFNRAAGGQIFSDQVSPTRWAFTWSNVPLFGTTTLLNSWQMQLDVSGTVTVYYQSMSLGGNNSLVGLSRGSSVTDPGNTDLSVAMPFLTGVGVAPMTLSQAAANPIVGSNYQLRVTTQPSNALACMLVYGFGQQNLPLNSIGMPGCTQLVTADATQFFPVTPNATLCTVVLPNQPGMIGFTFFTQVAEMAPGVNLLGIAATNGGRIRIGTF